MMTPSNHNQYFSRNPGSAFCTGSGVTATETGAGGTSCCATGAGAGAGAGSGAITLGGALFAGASFFFVFLTTCFGATCAAVTAGAGADCSAMAGAGAGSGAFSAGATTGIADSATTSFGLVAQADKASAEKRNAVDKAILRILDMEFSRKAIERIGLRGILP